MGRHTKKSIEKPDWFNLDNYRSASSKNLNQWEWNFTARVESLRLLDADKCEIIKYKKYYDALYLTKVIEPSSIFRKCGFILEPNNEFPNYFTSELASKKSPPIDSMSYCDIANSLECLNKDIKENILNVLRFGIDENNEELLNTKINCITEEEGFELNYSYAAVDLNMPLDVILESFKTWVIDEKTKHGGFDRRRLSIEDMRIWRDCKIIPYLDLIIWYKIQEKRMPIDDDLVDWLFPESHSSGLAKLRDVTKKILKKLQHGKYLEYIFNQQ